jgi:hypothetical protein
MRLGKVVVFVVLLWLGHAELSDAASIRFFGTSNYPSSAVAGDRVRVYIGGSPSPSANIGATDTTIEFWMKGNASDHIGDAPNCTNSGVFRAGDAAQIASYIGTLNLNADGNALATPSALTDGLLIYRALALRSGTGLSTAALGSGATRNAQQVIDWIRTTNGASCIP